MDDVKMKYLKNVFDVLDDNSLKQLTPAEKLYRKHMFTILKMDMNYPFIMQEKERKEEQKTQDNLNNFVRKIGGLVQ